MRLLDLYGMQYLLAGSLDAQNGAAVSVAGVATDIVIASALDFSVGDFVLARARVQMTKGATGGRTTLLLVQHAGAAVFEWLPGTSDTYQEDLPNIQANLPWECFLTEMMRCSGSGSATLKLQGISAGSNSNVPIARAALALRRFRA